MRNSLLPFFIFLLFSVVSVHAQETVFEQSNGQKTATYQQTIAFYKILATKYNTVKLSEVGETDTEYPLHFVMYSKNEKWTLAKRATSDKIVILINNGIHPGEPDGIDASMMLIRDAASGKIKVPDNVVLVVVPVFNIGGALNRNSFSRANQNGPESYGFRGNAQNLDLNRDFMKMDAMETQTLVKMFHMIDPDIFLDNHVSNGADYQHVMTLLSTQHNKLGGTMGTYLNSTFEPLIYSDMKKRGYDLVPYVNVWGKTPDSGWQAFIEPPRFASGWAALFQTYAFVAETHMLKPFKDRVLATYALMQSMIDIASKNAAEIKKTRREDRDQSIRSKSMVIDWQHDSTKSTMINFLGYEGAYKDSRISGKPRLYYDRTKPYVKQVPFYNYYLPKTTVTAPKAYIIKQGWGNSVVAKMRLNGVTVARVPKDTTMELTVYRIQDMNTTSYPYEGHYLHSNISVKKEVKKVKVMKGDYIIKTAQAAKRYIVESLEPQAPDAFLAWGFFDAVLQQKEHYSAYVFEDLGYQLLQDNEVLYNKYTERMKTDTAFANSGEAQLDFIYKNSPYYEQSHKTYPVYRVEY